MPLHSFFYTLGDLVEAFSVYATNKSTHWGI